MDDQAAITKKRVAIWGATGATGSELLRQCVSDPRVGSVSVFTRRPIAVDDPSVEQFIVDDFMDLSAVRAALAGMDAAFWCLGVSQSAVPDEQRYREITFDYTVTAARALRRESPHVAFHFLSGMGADPSGRSRMMWARVKGEAENALRDEQFKRLTIWRPGYILVVAGRDKPTPLGERIFAMLAPVLTLVPGMVNPTVDIAQAMLRADFDPAVTGLVPARRITTLAAEYRSA
jgi:uncharacterized protein YbjT (DUF2867 family)